MGEKELLPYRKKMQSVFQDPYSSLDPSHTVQDIICEPMAIHKMYTQKERKERAKELIRVVGLKEQDLLKYPHEFPADSVRGFPLQEHFPYSRNL